MSMLTLGIFICRVGDIFQISCSSLCFAIWKQVLNFDLWRSPKRNRNSQSNFCWLLLKLVIFKFIQGSISIWIWYW